MVVNQEDQWEKLKVMDVLVPEAVTAGLTATTKRGVIEELVGLLAKEGRVKDAEKTLAVLMEREVIGTTGIGQGIAIPHAKTDEVTQVSAALGISRRGVQFDSLDGEPVYIFFLLVAPPDSAGMHLKALGRISRMLRDKFFRQALREAKTQADILKFIKDEDQF